MTTKKLVFMKLPDCATSPIQIICDKKIFGDKLDHLTTGCSLLVRGKLVLSPVPEQPIEIVADTVHIFGTVHDPSSFPLAKVDLPLDVLRTMPHLECHIPMKAVIYSVRSELMTALTEFFQKESYTKVDMPLITFSECEGGCQPMQATLLLTSGKVTDIPKKTDDPSMVDFSQDFFGSKSSLTVSAQMELETQLPLGDVWTVTRAIRGEPSQTARHLCEFSMVELEKGFTSSAEDIIEVSEKCIKYCIQYVLTKCQSQLKFLESKLGKPIISKLQKYLDTPFVRITHARAVEMIQEHKEMFTSIPLFSDDLSSEHEKFIVYHYQLPVVVRKYPKLVKAFYMPVVTETGELVGGSQRIHDADQLTDRIRELGLDIKPLEFYVALRRNGSIPHGGMGMGFERLVKFITGVPSVKDCVPFPRYVGSGKTQ